MTPDHPLTRRAFVRGAALSGAALALPGVRPRVARAATNGKRVAIFGAGMSGLVAAHELAERGFTVDVYERLPQLGGKARSWAVPDTAADGRAGLPAEHGFRFFPGFYQHVPDSMARIPRPDRGDDVYHSLRALWDLPGERRFTPPTATTWGNLGDPATLAATIAQALANLNGVPVLQVVPELVDFIGKLMVYLTSCDARRRGEWDGTGWWAFLEADQRSEFFQNYIVRGTTQDLVAVKPAKASVLSAGAIVEAFVWNVSGYRGGPYTAPIARFLDGPTSATWLDPWVAYLQTLGVRFHAGQALAGLNVSSGRVASADVVDSGGTRRRVDADWFLPALPIDKAVPLLTTPDLLRSDGALEGLRDLQTDWMNGMQIYLKQETTTAKPLIFTFDHPWTLSAVTDSFLWQDDIAARYGDGTVKEVVSIDISTWDAATQGRTGRTTVVGKAARECTKDEVFQEIWATLKARYPGETAFNDDNLHSWYLDPALTWAGDGSVHDDEVLSVGTVGTWAKRPQGRTALPNLFLGGDWNQNIAAGTANMESGNLCGRIAAQHLLDASGRFTPPIATWQRMAPPQLDGAKAVDAARYAAGLPNLFEPAAGGLDAITNMVELVGNAVNGTLGR
jgi:uncharacterized protein with NAD-binding domain and iron-sulfur cluster